MASIKDVAHLSGCSYSTVSRVVNKKGNVSEDMEQRVLETIKQIGYVPNSIARSLKSSKTSTIGVIVPDISESFFSQIIKGINSLLGEKDYSMMLCDSCEDPDRERKLIGLLNENRVEGMIIATVQNDSSIESVIQQVNCPIVFVDNVPRTVRGLDSVSTNNIKASYLAVEHLARQGHSRIAAIMGKRTEYAGFDRYAGYLEVLAHQNVPVCDELIRFGDFKEQSGYEAMKELLSCGTDFTAVYIASSKMTYGALMAIREAGMRIPEELSVVGFDIQDEYKLMSPGITSICQQDREIGLCAADILFRRLGETASGVGVSGSVVLDPYLEIRDSSMLLKR